jgi:hypothetical protein
MCARVILLVFAALICTAECVQVPELLYGTVEVSAFATIDESLPSVQAELIDIKTRKTLRTADGGRIEQIPYGLYRLRVRAPGFYSVEQDLRVHQSKLGVRVQLVLGVECRVYSSLIGTVAPAEANRALWVKVIPLRGSGGIETPVVGSQGAFLAAGLDAGQYLVVVLEGERQSIQKC